MSTSTSADYPVNSWVWVKQSGYPWWPAMVLDPAQAGQDPPEGSDVVLLCGPSASATLVFASSADAEQLRPYHGAAADAELIEAGRSDESCAAAIEEMIAAVASTDAAPEEEGPQTTPSASGAVGEQGHHAFSGEDDVDWEALAAEAEATMAEPQNAVARKKRKEDKKRKKRKRNGSSGGDRHADGADPRKTRKDKPSKGHRRHRSGDADSANEAEVSSGDDEDDSENDEDMFQRRKGASSSRSAKKVKYERQSKLEEYDLGPGTLSDYSPRNDPAYYYRKVRSARRTASSTELQTCTQELRGFMSRCLSGAATALDVEADILGVLRQLKSVDVTVAQLQETGIGVAIGSLLRFFTPPVVQLAQAILNYWFHSLPQNTQQQLSAENEVDRCSIETCSDGVAGDNELGRIGVNLFSCFTNEEIDDAPASVDAMALCGAIEDALERRCDADAQMLVLSAFGDTGDTGKALRRLLLEGKIYVEDIINHTGNLPLLVRTRQRRPPNMQFTFNPPASQDRSDIDSPTSPYGAFSPNDDGSTGSPTFGSPAGRTTTALYSCPHCGANDAYQRSYSVQAHDNMPDILRCKKCGQTWNVAEQ
ncbi:PWWP domain/TFIIS helical bundle-like domain containing protein [Leishmania donovani]|uniref:PWWP_domain/TFIIS_helical_bundle-like_domain_containing_protein_-_putative n=3 Tax=Leishmania donovani species complex TaxID=38574 RepID=A0A6L0XTC1_LEIIN|nr:conserved hypothetical protein [Leishmania infantum JPCM5]TPP55405.1 PWWP domain family protein [Leishmania donovani]CAC9534320.1 PWWP_domain/TFIIS_helical_bundle-like_domain_containing_protein_-_putative [Leishmania infantum]CAJ1992284.1 PWWP domain/TFIIS helical bundle-like domain containing protein [Leishmania donovani]CAM71426.1 conserved hypothetical protein [Leishmania infantum JPCM5]SUZ45307.1 PWWP_domain/TFIIS_helical_bundle-like_domain_containing_protein_-_putative [Leishmania infa|eukprot:XP_001468342.1 conserved hypothetical protein [Leishmania infantum JPCM5]